MEQGWSGSILEGRRANGWLEGEARCVLPNGVIYEGQFQKGNFHGEGEQAKASHSETLIGKSRGVKLSP